MHPYFRFFIDLMLLRAAPQDIQSSRFLFWLVLFLTFTLAVVQGAFIFQPLKNLAFNAFDVTLLLLFVHFLLSFNGVLSRFWQTMTAILGTSVLFRILELPAYVVIQSSDQGSPDVLFVLAVMLVLALLMYNIFVIGHIFKHALSCTMAVGVLAAMGYVVINYSVMRLVFA